jgi:hypothetical protein
MYPRYRKQQIAVAPADLAARVVKGYATRSCAAPCGLELSLLALLGDTVVFARDNGALCAREGLRERSIDAPSRHGACGDVPQRIVQLHAPSDEPFQL